MMSWWEKTVTVKEEMRGTHHFVEPSFGGPEERPFYFVIEWRGDLGEVFNPRSDHFMSFDAEGVIHVGGLTPGEVSCSGSLSVDYLVSKTIRYALDFDHDGHRWHYLGEKVDVDLTKPIMLPKTHTTCYGTLTRDDGLVVSKSVVHFDPKTLWPFLRSFSFR